ncbi:amidohydrolase [Lacinutrix undariae]
MKATLILFLTLILVSCNSKINVDTLVINANVYTVNENFDTIEAFAIKDGKILDTGTSLLLQELYTAKTIINAESKTILPGFIDAHCHFLGLGYNQFEVDLVGAKSFEDVIKRILDFQNQEALSFIIGNGWDQNDWDNKQFPNNILLSKLFPNKPVVLRRIDGHAILCNDAALQLANITATTKVDGGEVVLKNGKPTGVLVDNALLLMDNYWPIPNRTQKVKALLAAQEIGFKNGLTTVSDAGLNRADIEIIDSLQQTGDLQMRVYAMVMATKENLEYYLNKGVVKTEKLNVTSFKFFADGALGSRGAALRESYSDHPNHFGTILSPLSDFDAIATRVANSNFQLNTHAIGDSTNHVVLQTYKSVLQGQKDRRWRVEHAQVIAPEDFKLFNDIVPSVQPTHATSDMYWAEERLGAERLKTTYAYKQLLNAHGKIALGTDFPVEKVSPFLTFYAAVGRQDINQFPKDGFQVENALTREEALRGMTIWAAYANFEDHEKGSIEIGKYADFIILDKDLMTIPMVEVPNIKVEKIVIDGVVR